MESVGILVADRTGDCDMKNQIVGQMSFMDILNYSDDAERCMEESRTRNEKDTCVQEKEEFSIPVDIEQRMKSIEDFSRADCEKCDCAFGSRRCFKNRGYQFDCLGHFIRGEDGKQLRRLTKLKCLKELAEEPPILKKGCWLSTRDFGNNRMCATEECNRSCGCVSCDRYIGFYGYVEELQEKNGITFSEAIKIAKIDGYDRR